LRSEEETPEIGDEAMKLGESSEEETLVIDEVIKLGFDEETTEKMMNATSKMMKKMEIQTVQLEGLEKDFSEFSTVHLIDNQMMEREKEIRRLERNRVSISRKIKELTALSEKLQIRKNVEKSRYDKLKSQRKHFFLDVNHKIKKSRIEVEKSTQTKKRSHQRILQKILIEGDGETDQCAFINSKNRRCGKLGRFTRKCGDHDALYCNTHVLEIDERWELNPKFMTRST